MKYRILNKNDYKLSSWSGGDTNELYIYPKTSEYKKRNFMFRISTATVKDEKSTFTKLNGIERTLMTLTGKLKLSFKDKYEKELDKYEAISFSGDWDTTSYGKVTDFNLMTNSGCCGGLQHMRVLKNHFYLLKLENKNSERFMECIYNLGEEVTISIEDEEIRLKSKETLILDFHGNESKSLLKVINNTDKNVDLIRATVYFK